MLPPAFLFAAREQQIAGWPSIPLSSEFEGFSDPDPAPSVSDLNSELTDHNERNYLMREARIDAIIASTRENVVYLSGFESQTQLHLKSTVYVMIQTVDPFSPVLFLPVLETGALSVARPKADVRFYGKYFIVAEADPRGGSSIDKRAVSYIRDGWTDAAPSAEEALTRAIRSSGLSSARIGLELRGQSTDGYLSLKELNPNVEFVDATGLLLRMRMIKNRTELGLLKEAIRIAESSITTGLNQVQEGVTELDLSTLIRRELTRSSEPGVVNTYFGRNSAYILRDHLRTPISSGDQIWADVGCYHRGYCSDTGLTAVFGRAGNKLRTYHDSVLKAQRKALSTVKSGVPASELHRAAVAEARKVIPHFDRTHVGHGIGVGHYEPPRLSAENDTILEEGMVLNIETPYFEVGFGGLMVEDTLLVLKDGYELISSLSKELREVGNRVRVPHTRGFRNV